MSKWRSDEDDDNMKNEVNDRVDEDLTTEEFMAGIVEALTVPADSEDENRNIRKDFSILFPDGTERSVSLHPADTLGDLARLLRVKFGPECLFIGVKIEGVTQPPPIPYCIGMFKEEEWKQQLSIVYCSCQ